MSKLAFINYRRSDSSAAARAIYEQLQFRFGHQQVFMDVSSIAPSQEWPQHIFDQIGRTNILISIIGPHWLSAADKYHRRRIDSPEDWVHLEIVEAFKNKIPIMPLFLNETSIPPAEALPRDLSKLPKINGTRIRDDSWEDDFERICRTLITEHSFCEAQERIQLPQPHVDIPAFSTAELYEQMKTIPRWELVETKLPGEYPKTRNEIRRTYNFRSFNEALKFMNTAALVFTRAKHHPRWENQWRSLTIHLSTWDIGHKISALDLQIAHELDMAYLKFTRKQSETRH